MACGTAQSAPDKARRTGSGLVGRFGAGG